MNLIVVVAIVIPTVVVALGFNQLCMNSDTLPTYFLSCLDDSFFLILHSL